MKTGEKILIGVGTIIILDYLFAQVNQPKIIVKDNLPYNYNAQTLPPFGIYVKSEHAHNLKLIDHEMTHWKQYQRSGALLFYITYLSQKAIHGYDNMPMEIEPRIATGEKAECLHNYTQCVRNGQSAIIHDPNFRQAV